MTSLTVIVVLLVAFVGTISLLVSSLRPPHDGVRLNRAAFASIGDRRLPAKFTRRRQIGPLRLRNIFDVISEKFNPQRASTPSEEDEVTEEDRLLAELDDRAWRAPAKPKNLKYSYR